MSGYILLFVLLLRSWAIKRVFDKKRNKVKLSCKDLCHLILHTIDVDQNTNTDAKVVILD
jgi:hypothetical protein